MKVIEKLVEVFGEDGFEIKNKRTAEDVLNLEVTDYEIKQVGGKPVHYFATNGKYKVQGSVFTLYFYASLVKKTGKYRVSSSR